MKCIDLEKIPNNLPKKKKINLYKTINYIKLINLVRNLLKGMENCREVYLCIKLIMFDILVISNSLKENISFKRQISRHVYNKTSSNVPN